jgi:hypothetical protein
LKAALNKGILPKGVSALVEQRAAEREPDELAVEWQGSSRRDEADDGSLMTLDPPATAFTFRTATQTYAARANRIAIKHRLGRTLAIIEIVSPGNKDSKAALSDFVQKAIEFLQAGVHLLIIDLFPPTPRDPDGIHQRIWDEIGEDRFAFPASKNRTLSSYQAGREKVAYVQPIAVGDLLPEMPLFLWEGKHVKVPLEPSYHSAWNDTPEIVQRAVETGVLPDFDARA